VLHSGRPAARSSRQRQTRSATTTAQPTWATRLKTISTLWGHTRQNGALAQHPANAQHPAPWSHATPRLPLTQLPSLAASRNPLLRCHRQCQPLPLRAHSPSHAGCRPLSHHGPWLPAQPRHPRRPPAPDLHLARLLSYFQVRERVQVQDSQQPQRPRRTHVRSARCQPRACRRLAPR